MALASFFPYLQYRFSRPLIHQITDKVKQVYLKAMLLFFLISTAFQAFPQSISSVKISVLKNELVILAGRTDRLADSIRVENLNQIALYQSTTSLDSALLTLNKAEAISVKAGMTDLTAVTSYNRGQVFEQHGDFGKAEHAYLRWFNMRKKQDTRKYRWAMTGMREFYSRHLQFDKLEVIDNEWVTLLDGQLAAGEEVLYTYEASMLAVVDNLVNLGEYYKAESYFLHLLDNDPGSVYWLQGSMFYFRIEDKFLDIGDVETLRDWYTRWFTALNKYNSDVMDAIKTMNIVSGHLKYEPQLASQLIGTLFDLTVSSEDQLFVQSFTDYWIPLLDKVALREKEEKKGDPVTNRFIQYGVILNTHMAYKSTVINNKLLENLYLKSAKDIADCFHSLDGINVEEFISYLTNIGETTEDKKIKKTMKKMVKQLKAMS